MRNAEFGLRIAEVCFLIRNPQSVDLRPAVDVKGSGCVRLMTARLSPGVSARRKETRREDDETKSAPLRRATAQRVPFVPPSRRFTKVTPRGAPQEISKA